MDGAGTQNSIHEMKANTEAATERYSAEEHSAETDEKPYAAA
jgi:hypothetical protein